MRAIALVVGMMAFTVYGTGTASAVPPTAQDQFSPDEVNGDGGTAHGPDATGETREHQVASDAFTNFDQAYPFRAVTDPTASFYEWYDCTPGGDIDVPGQCALIATDSTPGVSNPPPLTAVVETWSATYNIPQSSEPGAGSRDSVGYACTGTPPATVPASGDCIVDRISAIHFDDASTSADHPADTTSGDIISIRPADRADVHGATVSNLGFFAVAVTSDDTGTPTGPVDAVLFCLDLDSNPIVPNDNAAVDGAGGDTIQDCDVTSEAGAVDIDEDDNPFLTGACTFNVGVSGSDCWEVFIDPPNNEEFSLSIIEIDDDDAGDGVTVSGEGDCAGISAAGGGVAGPPSTLGDDCELDKIYLTSAAPVLSQTHIHNDELCAQETAGGPPPIPTGECVAGDRGDAPTGTTAGTTGRRSCEQGDRAKGGPVTAGDTDELIGCFFNQFDDPDADGDKDPDADMGLPNTFDLSGTDASFSACPGGALHDHDLDALNEHCHHGAGAGAGNSNGTFVYRAVWSDPSAGAVTAVFCHDPDQGLAATTTDPDHGCDDATASEKDTANKAVGGGDFDHAHNWFDPADSRTEETYDAVGHNGDSQDQRVEQTNNVLHSFHHDAFHNAVPDGTRVLWGAGGLPPFVDPDDPTELTAVDTATSSPAGVPPGFAKATATSGGNAGGKTGIVSVCTDGIPVGGDGVCDVAVASVQINWQESPGGPGGGGQGQQNCPGGFDNIRGTRNNDKIKGDRGCDKIRGLKGNDKLVGRKGDDRLIGGPGKDRLLGGGGFDICSGNKGKDTFKGCERIKKR